MNSQPVLIIDVDDTFTYDGSGNMLLDYIFTSMVGVGENYEGPLWQAVPTNNDFYRVASHTEEGNAVFSRGAIRTQLIFGSEDPVSPRRSGGSGCALNPEGKFGFEWLLLIFSIILLKRRCR